MHPTATTSPSFARALGAQGNVRTRTTRVWPQSEFHKLVSELTGSEVEGELSEGAPISDIAFRHAVN